MQEVSMFLEENTLLFILEGVLKIRFGELQYEITNNEIAFFKRDILIEYTTADSGNAGSGVEFVIVSFNNELVKEFTRLAELPDVSHEDTPPISVNSINARLLKYIDSLEPYFFEPEKVKESLVKIKLMELLFYLAEMKNQVLEQLLDLREQFRHNITSTVEENIMNSISLNQLAGLSGRSLSSFRRDFQAIYNMPPSQWIRQKRLAKAGELLQSTNMTVTDVCYTSGFESVAHFSRLFKSQYGYSPSEFRGNKLVA